MNNKRRNRLFEEDETSIPNEREIPSQKPSQQVSDEDLDILDQELNTTPSPEQSEGMASSSSMDIMTVLKNISSWKDEFEKSIILDSFIAGSDIIENNTERQAFQYITKNQYGAFSSLIDSSREIATLINDLSFDAKKLLGEIELSKKMMISNEE